MKKIIFSTTISLTLLLAACGEEDKASNNKDLSPAESDQSTLLDEEPYKEYTENIIWSGEADKQTSVNSFIHYELSDISLTEKTIHSGLVAEFLEVEVEDTVQLISFKIAIENNSDQQINFRMNNAYIEVNGEQAYALGWETPIEEDIYEPNTKQVGTYVFKISETALNEIRSFTLTFPEVLNQSDDAVLLSPFIHSLTLQK